MNADNFPSPLEDTATDNVKTSNPKVKSRRPSIVDAKKKGIVTTQSTLDTLPSDKSLLEEAAEDEKNRQGSIVRRRLMKASQSFQAVRPAGLITPNFDNTSTSEPANLINQSRNMRRALDLSCHGQRPSELTGALSDIFMDNPLDGTEDDDDDDEHQFKLGDPLHEPSTCLGRSRNSVGRVVNLNFVQWTLMFLIIANSLILGALTFVHDNPVARSALESTDLALLIVFTVELTAQLYYLGLQFFRNGWLIFDCVVIVASWAFEGSELTVMRENLHIIRLVLEKAKNVHLLYVREPPCRPHVKLAAPHDVERGHILGRLICIQFSDQEGRAGLLVGHVIEDMPPNWCRKLGVDGTATSTSIGLGVGISVQGYLELLGLALLCCVDHVYEVLVKRIALCLVPR